MIPVITNEAKNSIISYLTNSCVAILINMPELGLDDNPTPQELEARKSLTMDTAVSYEVGGLNLNGYQRVKPDITLENNNSITYSASYEAKGGNLGPFSHMCIARGVPFTIDPATGNGRGSMGGQVILVVPVISSNAVILEEGQLYESSATLTISM